MKVNIFALLLVVNLKLGTSQWSTVYYNISEERVEKFPWMVVIGNKTASEFVSYGALVNKQAVLTTTIDSVKSLSNLEVYAQCYFDSNITNKSNELYRCPEVRQVIEYNIIKKYDSNQMNSVILILDTPFELSNKINIATMAKNSYQPQYPKQIHCMAAALRTCQSLTNNATARFFSLLPVHIQFNLLSEMYLPISVTYKNYHVYVDKGYETFKNYPAGYVMDLTGGPVMCKRRDEKGPWMLIGISKLKFQFLQGRQTKMTGAIMRTDNATLQEIFEEIINHSMEMHHKITFHEKN